MNQGSLEPIEPDMEFTHVCMHLCKPRVHLRLDPVHPLTEIVESPVVPFRHPRLLLCDRCLHGTTVEDKNIRNWNLSVNSWACFTTSVSRSRPLTSRPLSASSSCSGSSGSSRRRRCVSSPGSSGGGRRFT